MASHRINYGIDLGTTNSAIARMNRGQAVVIKNQYQRDTTPSAVAIGRRGRIQVGPQAYNQIREERLRVLKKNADDRSAFVEFKRTMGTDHVYRSSADGASGFTSEQLSKEVLKELKRHAPDDVRAAVVTIPAAFTVPQQDATQRAAGMAGIRQCHLLQEPVAAAMAYGLDSTTAHHKWLVFDFGGGTFDAALVLVDEGQIVVKDTEGDNHLGGKDLDRAVVEEIILQEILDDHDVGDDVRAHLSDPGVASRLRDALRFWAERANIELSSRDTHFVESQLEEIELPDGLEIVLDFEITRDRLRPAVEPSFQRAIDKARTLLARHGLDGSDLDELILVGGPTYSPILRGMLAEQIRTPNTSVDPMTVVARGAALFASTVELDREHVEAARASARDVVALEVDYESTSIAHAEFVTVKFADPIQLQRLGEVGVEFRRTGTGWSSGRQQLGEDGALFELVLEENKSNAFDIIMTVDGSRVGTDPSEITIIQGTRVAGSPLPNPLGVEVWADGMRDMRVFKPLKGAEKGRLLPITGFSGTLTTDREIRPGVPSDRLLIRIFEGNPDPNNLNPKVMKPIGLFRPVLSCELTGDQVGRVIPARTEFELTLKTGPTASLPESITVLFLSEDDEYEIDVRSQKATLQTDWVVDELNEARRCIVRVRAGELARDAAVLRELAAVEADIADAEAMINRAGNLEGMDAAVDDFNTGTSRLREALKQLYDIVAKNEWPEARARMDAAWRELRDADEEDGHAAASAEVQGVGERVRAIDKAKNAVEARRLTQEIRGMMVRLFPTRLATQIIHWARYGFSRISWKNPGRARAEVDAGILALTAGRPGPELLEHARRILGQVAADADSPRPPVPHL